MWLLLKLDVPEGTNQKYNRVSYGAIKGGGGGVRFNRVFIKLVTFVVKD